MLTLKLYEDLDSNFEYINQMVSNFKTLFGINLTFLKGSLMV